MGILFGVFVIMLALAIAYWEGEEKELSLGGFAFIAVLGLMGAVAFMMVGIDYSKGSPKPINDNATGAYTTLSRVNEGNASYSVVKDADGNIRLLQGKAKMPSLKSFAVNKKGEVVELK